MSFHDMLWAEVPDALAEGADAAFERLRAASADLQAFERALPVRRALGDPDWPAEEQALQQHCDTAFDTWERESPFLFRFDSLRLRLCRQAMAGSGMAVDSRPPGPRPDPDRYGPGARGWVRQHGLAPRPWPRDPAAAYPDSPQAAAYLDDVTAWARAHQAAAPGIPLHKLDWGGPWHVMPDEIRQALDHAPDTAVAEVGDASPQPIRWWPAWLDYLHQAAGHGGFEVW